jgi:hypothetical protein
MVPDIEREERHRTFHVGVVHGLAVQHRAFSPTVRLVRLLALGGAAVASVRVGLVLSAWLRERASMVVAGRRRWSWSRLRRCRRCCCNCSLVVFYCGSCRLFWCLLGCASLFHGCAWCCVCVDRPSCGCAAICCRDIFLTRPWSCWWSTASLRQGLSRSRTAQWWDCCASSSCW